MGSWWQLKGHFKPQNTPLISQQLHKFAGISRAAPPASPEHPSSQRAPQSCSALQQLGKSSLHTITEHRVPSGIRACCHYSQLVLSTRKTAWMPAACMSPGMDWQKSSPHTSQLPHTDGVCCCGSEAGLGTVRFCPCGSNTSAGSRAWQANTRNKVVTWQGEAMLCWLILCRSLVEFFQEQGRWPPTPKTNSDAPNSIENPCRVCSLHSQVCQPHRWTALPRTVLRRISDRHWRERRVLFPFLVISGADTLLGTQHTTSFCLLLRRACKAASFVLVRQGITAWGC